MEEEVAEGLFGAFRSVLPHAGLEKGSCQLSREASQLLTETQDLTCFSSLAQGVCAAPVTNTGCVSRQAICSLSQCGEKSELFCCTCVQREHGAGVTGICHTCSVSKREFGGLNTTVGLVCAVVRCCEGHHETNTSGKEWDGFF